MKAFPNPYRCCLMVVATAENEARGARAQRERRQKQNSTIRMRKTHCRRFPGQLVPEAQGFPEWQQRRQELQGLGWMSLHWRSQGSAVSRFGPGFQEKQELGVQPE